MKLSPYRKAVAAALAAVAYAGIVAWQATALDGLQWPDLFPVVAAVGAALLTYFVPLFPDAQHLKTLVAGVLQGVAAVAVLFQNGGPAPNLAAVVVAVAGTFAVHRVTNTPVVQA